MHDEMFQVVAVLFYERLELLIKETLGHIRVCPVRVKQDQTVACYFVAAFYFREGRVVRFTGEAYEDICKALEIVISSTRI